MSFIYCCFKYAEVNDLWFPLVNSHTCFHFYCCQKCKNKLVIQSVEIVEIIKCKSFKMVQRNCFNESHFHVESIYVQRAWGYMTFVVEQRKLRTWNSISLTAKYLLINRYCLRMWFLLLSRDFCKKRKEGDIIADNPNKKYLYRKMLPFTFFQSSPIHT